MSVVLVLSAFVLVLGGAGSAAAAELGSISGTVTDASTHEPLQGIEVCAYSEEGEEFGFGCDVTDASGEYTIAGLIAGEYLVEFWPEELPYVPQFYNGKSSSQEAQLIVVKGDAHAGIDAEMERAGGIEGAVNASASGKPVEEVFVCAIEVPAEEVVRCGETDANGDYAVGRLPAGEFKVEFWPGFTGLNLQTQYYNHKATWAEAEPVAVAAGESVSGIDAQLDPGAEINGTVYDGSTNAPLRFRLVCSALAGSGELTQCTETNAAGRYSLYGLSSATYKVAFSLEFREFFPEEPPEPDGYLTQFYNGKSTLAAADPLAVVAPNVLGGIDAHLVSSTPMAQPPVVIASPPRHHRKPLRCRRHFRKVKVKGKARCVKIHHRRRHHHKGRAGRRAPLRLLAVPR